MKRVKISDLSLGDVVDLKTTSIEYNNTTSNTGSNLCVVIETHYAYIKALSVRTSYPGKPKDKRTIIQSLSSYRTKLDTFLPVWVNQLEEDEIKTLTTIIKHNYTKSNGKVAIDYIRQVEFYSTFNSAFKDSIDMWAYKLNTAESNTLIKAI